MSGDRLPSPNRGPPGSRLRKPPSPPTASPVAPSASRSAGSETLRRPHPRVAGLALRAPPQAVGRRRPCAPPPASPAGCGLAPRRSAGGEPTRTTSSTAQHKSRSGSIEAAACDARSHREQRKLGILASILQLGMGICVSCDATDEGAATARVVLLAASSGFKIDGRVRYTNRHSVCMISSLLIGL